jgi:dTDP-4-amino-4,6-dideoxygalactose transaminase
MTIPYLSFTYMNNLVRKDLVGAMEQVLDSNEYILGKQVEWFESEYAAYCAVGACVGVSNGLDALRICLELSGVKKGDEVIVPSNTYIATVLAISHMGAIPVFVEPDQHSWNMDTDKIASAITSRTKAIIPVHLYGQACRMDVLMKIAEERGLYVIEDNAQSQGAAYQGRKTGSWGHINATSFFPTKNLGALGDAGAVTCQEGSWVPQIKMLRNYGSVKKYHNEILGFNMRLDELQGAILRVKLKYLDDWNRQRQQIAAQYSEGLKGTGDVILPSTIPGASHVYHVYMICTAHRDALQNHLTRMGIGTLIHYPVPPHLQPAYAFLGYQPGDLPIAEKLASTCLSLPIWPGMAMDQVDSVILAIRDFFQLKTR